jgi:hypothetical protein
LQQFTRSLYLTISLLILSTPGLDKGGPYDPKDNGYDSPDDGIEENIILQVQNQGMENLHRFLFSLIPMTLPSKMSIGRE